MLQSKTNKLELLPLNSQGCETIEDAFDLSPLARALRTNSFLRHLDLSNNCTIDGRTRIVESLKISGILEANWFERIGFVVFWKQRSGVKKLWAN
jgi:hypothetical protein